MAVMSAEGGGDKLQAERALAKAAIDAGTPLKKVKAMFKERTGEEY